MLNLAKLSKKEISKKKEGVEDRASKGVRSRKEKIVQKKTTTVPVGKAGKGFKNKFLTSKPKSLKRVESEFV